MIASWLTRFLAKHGITDKPMARAERLDGDMAYARARADSLVERWAFEAESERLARVIEGAIAQGRSERWKW